MLSKGITIKNQSGLHMRPAGVFAKVCMPYKSDVFFSIRGNTYNGKSVMKVLSAAVKCGDGIELRIDGEDEADCMDAIVAAVESGLGE